MKIMHKLQQIIVKYSPHGYLPVFRLAHREQTAQKFTQFLHISQNMAIFACAIIDTSVFGVTVSRK